jgi:hypothetical protein
MVDEGNNYVLEKVMLGFNEGDFKITSHKYKLNATLNTKFTKIHDPTISISKVNFKSFKLILDSTDEDKLTGN